MTDTPLNGNLKIVLIAAAAAGLLGAGGGYAGSQALDTSQAVLTVRVEVLEKETDGLDDKVTTIRDNQLTICQVLGAPCER